MFTHTRKTPSPHLNNVLTLPCENETSQFILLYRTLRINHWIKRGMKNKVHQLQRKQTDILQGIFKMSTEMNRGKAAGLDELTIEH